MGIGSPFKFIVHIGYVVIIAIVYNGTDVPEQEGGCRGRRAAVRGAPGADLDQQAGAPARARRRPLRPCARPPTTASPRFASCATRAAPGARARDNLLIRGDALNALHSLAELPEFAREYLGKVKLAYLDPPFNTQQSFLHYDDALEHSVWLTMLRDRLLQVKALLSDDGSVWVHCDDSEMAYLKVAMDEIFGRKANTG